MLLLTSTSDKIQVVTTAAGAIDMSADWVDNTTSAITPGRTLFGAVATATTTDLVGSPAASTQRSVKFMSVYNESASVSNVITIIQTDGSASVTLWSGTLSSYESVIFDGNNFFRINSAGTLVTQGLGGPTDVQVFTTIGANTWTKPTSFTPKSVMVKLWGAGGGGGAGASLATAVVAKGGAAGGGDRRAHV